jgi:hypothetical protein
VYERFPPMAEYDAGGLDGVCARQHPLVVSRRMKSTQKRILGVASCAPLAQTAGTH